MSDSLREKTINIITLGCSKNLVDSEQLLKQLEISSYAVTHDSNEYSDIVVINTCGFINDAKQESIDTILNCLEAKSNGLIEKVFVMGCMSERYRTELKKELQDVDGFYGVADLEQILKDLDASYRKDLLSERTITTPKHYAYLKIAEGCNRKCSFCAIPLIRGKFVSKPIDNIIEEAEKLVANGVKEILLIAQDLTSYGLDLYKESRLKELVEKLSNIKNLEWIRLHYTYPIYFSDELLDLIKTKSNICNYIDIPLQHINDKLLKSMRRGISGNEQRLLIKRIKDRIPDVAIRTTMIVGYPGETDQDFQELKSYIQEEKFDRLGVFVYSPEEDTSAYKLKDDVPDNIKNQRQEDLMKIQEEISEELNAEKINKKYKVIIDREEGDFFVGRTEHDSPEVDNEVLIPISRNCKIGEFYEVKIHSASAFDLLGELV